MSGKATTEKNKTKKAESLPKGWKRVRLGEILQYKQPTAYIVKNENYDEKSGIPVLTAGKTFILGYTAEEFGVFDEIPVIIFDDFTTESRFVDFPFKVKSSALKILKLKDYQSNLYFIYNLMQIIPFKPGSEHKRFWISEYSKIQVFLPPLPEQQKIAEILETVDNTIEKTDAIIEKYRRIKKGLMADLLTGKIRLIPYGHSEAESEESPRLTSPEAKKFVIGDKTFVAVPNQRWKNSPIGKIPADWDVRKLGEIGEIVSGYTFPISFQGKDYGQYPFVKVDDLNIDNKFILSAKNYIDDYEINFLGIMVLPPSTIVFPKIGMAVYLNKFRILKVNAVFDNNITGVIFKGSICIPEFYYFYFAAKIDLKKIAYETALPSIPTQALKSLFLPLPPLPEQQLIADVLSQVDEVIEKEIQYKEKLERIKKGLMEDLLTGKVRVNNLIKEDIQNDTKIS